MIKPKNYIISSYIILIIVTGLSIGFSSFNNELSIQDISATVKINADIRITSTYQEDAYNGAYSTSLDYNVNNIISAIKGLTPEEIVESYKGKGYADLKKDTAEVIISELAPIQEKVKNLLNDKKHLESIYKSGADKANYVANKVLRKIQKKIGLIPR